MRGDDETGVMCCWGGAFWDAWMLGCGVDGQGMLVMW